MVAEETITSEWDHHLNSLLEDLHSIGSPRDGRVIEHRDGELPNVKHTTTEYTSPDHRTHTRTDRYEYQSGPQENDSSQKIVQHSSMMYRSNRNTSNSLRKSPALTRSESLNRSESLRRRARDPSPDLRLTMHDDMHYATPPPPLPTQRLKQNIVELDSLLHDLNSARRHPESKTSRTEVRTVEMARTRGTSISHGVTSEGTQTETPKSSTTELRTTQPLMEPISHSTPQQQRKQMSSESSSYPYKTYSDTLPSSSYKSYSTEHVSSHLQLPQPTSSSRAYSSEHISGHTQHREPSPIPPFTSTGPDSDSDSHAKTIVKNYHYYYTLDGTMKPGVDGTHSPQPPHDSKAYHYTYVIGPDGQPSGQPAPQDTGSKPDTHPPHDSKNTVITHRAYNYSWSSQGGPTDGPSTDKPDRYYIVEDGKPSEPPYGRRPVDHHPSGKPKPFPVAPQDERPSSGISYPPESHTSYHYSWDSRKEHMGPPFPGNRDSSPSPHTVNTYNYSWSYPGQPEMHPTPPTQPADSKPPKKLDDLMASFSDIEDAPPTPPIQDKKPQKVELTPANAPSIHVGEAETMPLVEKKTVTIEKSVSKAGSPVYYPPSYSDPKPLQETPKPKPMWRMEMEKEKMKGKYKYRESESKSEFKAIPLCLPLCCAAPLCCEIM